MRRAPEMPQEPPGFLLRSGTGTPFAPAMNVQLSVRMEALYSELMGKSIAGPAATWP